MEEIDAAINQVYTDYMKKNEKQPTKLLNAKNVIMTAYAAGKKGQYNPITLSLFSMDKDMQKLDKLFRQLNQMTQPQAKEQSMFKKGGTLKFQDGGKLAGMPDKLNADGVVFDMTTAVGKAMFNSWAKKNPKAYDAKMKELGFYHSLPEYTVYGAKAEETHNALTALKKQGVKDAFGIWGTNGSPTIMLKKALYGANFNHTPGTTPIMNIRYEDQEDMKQKLIGQYGGTLSKALAEIEKRRTEASNKGNGMTSLMYESQADILKSQAPKMRVSDTDFFAEIAHSNQLMKMGSVQMGKRSSHDDATLSDSLQYRTPGTIEHEAHSIIQPILTKQKNGIAGAGQKIYYIKSNRKGGVVLKLRKP